MQDQIIQKLLVSFDKLENSINLTEETLLKKENVPVYVLNHVREYRTILDKQRNLALDLEVQIKSNNWQEVARYVKLINGLSSMIRDDARSLLEDSEPSPKRETAKEVSYQ